MKKFIGLDIGGTKCAVILARVNKGIEILSRTQFPSLAHEGCESMIRRIIDGVNGILEKNSLSPRDIEAIGISCGGPLDSASGCVMSPPNLPGWDNIPLTSLLENAFGVPAYLQNDANACALVEWKLGAGRGTDNIIFCTMGTGMGAGIISGGRLLTGANDMAGEIGHIRLSEDGPEGYGKNGSFEGWVSGGGIGRYASMRTEEAVKSGHIPAWRKDGVSDVTAKVLSEYASKGDPDAIDIYNQVGAMLGRGLALLADTVNPEKIVIGSVFVRAEKYIRPGMEKVLKEECLSHTYNALTVCPAETGEAIGDLASVMTALYAMDIDPMTETEETEDRVLCHLDKMVQKYPHLECVKNSLYDAYISIRDAYKNGGKLLVCGNGGSCADAEHIVGELMKGFYLKRPIKGADENSVLRYLQGALPAIALTGHTALSTAFNNDEDPAYTYAQQTYGYGRKGDVLIGISTSGNAKNVANAVLCAKEIGMTAIALTGGSGGRLKEICDISVIAPGNCPADVQECHLPIYHTLCAMLESAFFEE